MRNHLQKNYRVSCRWPARARRKKRDRQRQTNRSRQYASPLSLKNRRSCARSLGLTKHSLMSTEFQSRAFSSSSSSSSSLYSSHAHAPSPVKTTTVSMLKNNPSFFSASTMSCAGTLIFNHRVIPVKHTQTVTADRRTILHLQPFELRVISISF